MHKHKYKQPMKQIGRAKSARRCGERQQVHWASHAEDGREDSWKAEEDKANLRFIRFLSWSGKTDNPEEIRENVCKLFLSKEIGESLGKVLAAGQSYPYCFRSRYNTYKGNKDVVNMNCTSRLCRIRMNGCCGERGNRKWLNKA